MARPIVSFVVQVNDSYPNRTVIDLAARRSTREPQMQMQDLSAFVASLGAGMVPSVAFIGVDDNVSSCTVTCTHANVSSGNHLLRLGTEDFVAVTSGATGNQFNIGADSTAMATNLAAAINARAGLAGIVVATAAAGVVTIKSIIGGAYSRLRAAARGTQSTGTVTVTYANVTNGDTVTVGGVTFTVVASSPTNVQFVAGANGTDTAANLAAAINANPTARTLVLATPNAAVVTIQARAQGSVGNLIGLATNDATAFAVSAATLASGVANTSMVVAGDSLESLSGTAQAQAPRRYLLGFAGH